MANHPSKNVKSVKRWSPNPAPADQAQLPDYLFRELNRLSDTVFNIDTMSLAETFKVPEKPRNGDIRYFGDTWPTGSGMYWYDGTSWQTFGSGGGGGPVALNDLTDVDTTGKSTGDFIYWDGATWSITSVAPGGFSGSYNDLTNKPFIPSDVGDLTDTGNLLDHFSGDYNDLTNQPTIPAAANNGTITINQGGVLKGTFTVDQATNTTVELDAGGAAASKTWIDYATGFSSVPSVIDTVDNTNWSEDGDVYEYTYSNGTLYRVIGATIDGFYNSFNALANPALTGLVAQKAITI